jgi:hypothetical protein
VINNILEDNPMDDVHGSICARSLFNTKLNIEFFLDIGIVFAFDLGGNSKYFFRATRSKFLRR